MANQKTLSFDKDLFKRSVVYNVKTLYRKSMEEATPQQVFQAVSYSIKDAVIDHWMTSREEYEKQDPKMVYYLSMEFLMGRALGNNIINLQAYKPVKEALDELGRLAACFLDSLATLGYSAYGCGIRYRYGMFKQQIRDGYQVEVPDNWLENGNPFELRRPEYAKEVKFGGYVNVYVDEKGRSNFKQEGYQSVKAIPYDLPIVGYGNGIVIHCVSGMHSRWNALSWIRLIKATIRRRWNRITWHAISWKCFIPMTTTMRGRNCA